MKSRTLPIYKSWLDKRNPENPLHKSQIDFVDQVYAECEANYHRGGDTIVEAYTPDEVLHFKSMNDMRRFVGLKVEQATNFRWGEDTDPELAAVERHKDWEKT